MKIPENAKPYRAIVNGVEHVYEAGADVEVAPGVEELIEAADNFPAAPDPVVPPFAGGGGGGGVLVVTLTSTVVDEQEIWSTDKTAGEIFAALPNATFQQADNMGIYKIYSTAAYAEMDGLFHIVLLALAELNSPNFAPMEMYAASADAVMTTQELSDDPGDK